MDWPIIEATPSGSTVSSIVFQVFFYSRKLFGPGAIALRLTALNQPLSGLKLRGNLPNWAIFGCTLTDTPESSHRFVSAAPKIANRATSLGPGLCSALGSIMPL